MSENGIPGWEISMLKEMMEKFAQEQQDLLHIPGRPQRYVAQWTAAALGESVEEVWASLEKARSDAFLRVVLLIKYQWDEVDIPIHLLDSYIGAAPREYVRTRADLMRKLREIDVNSALERLAGEFFPRGAVFHTKGWHVTLDRAFRDRQVAEDVTFGTLWYGRLVPVGLLAAIPGMPGDTRLKDIYAWVRRELRKDIERNLLSGQTLEEFLGRGEVPWPEPGTPQALALQRRYTRNFTRLVDMRLDIFNALSSLSAREARAVLAQSYGIRDEELEAKGDGTCAAIRKRRERAKRKLRVLLR